jgi:hypothetical protein
VKKWHSVQTIFGYPFGWWAGCACGWESIRHFPVEYLAEQRAQRHVDSKTRADKH